MPDLEMFTGDWAVARVIEDRRAGANGAFTGTARFTPREGGLLYSERGMLTLGRAAAVEASQSYLWAQVGDRIVIRFSDGRPFHDIAADGMAPDAHHHCAPDDYRVRYDFGGWHHWHAVWTVSGPRKDYTMRTDYHRVP